MACSVNPVTGKNQLSLVSTNQELAIGEKNYLPSQQSQGGQYLIDSGVQAYVAEVGRRLALVSDAPNLPYEFVVLNNSVPNAWALPGGKIAVNRGLLVLLEDESELAAVLGHEIVHAAARHSASQMTRGSLLSMGSQIATIAASTEGYGQLAGLASQIGGGAYMAKYGRSAELESDYYGMKYMSEAGYSPLGAVRLQELFMSLKGDKAADFFSELFASHPPSQERAQANRERAAALPVGETYMKRYQKNIAQLIKDKEAYKAQEKAVIALKAKRAKVALAHLDTAVSIQPQEGQFWELRGLAWEILGNTSNAEKAFSTAIKKSPYYFSPKLYRGMLRYKQGNKKGAAADLKASYQLLPTRTAAFYLGELSLSRGDKNEALNYYRNASGSGDIGGQAQTRVVTLELAQQPDKYVLSRPYVASNGYLKVAVKNSSNILVEGVKVQLGRLQSSGIMGQVRTLKGIYTLSPGQEISVRTNIGPLDSAGAASSFRSKVSVARPAQRG
ncbi:MAG: putative Zn-dependent protease [Halioglobus sp.]|jgi:predicted Zn-dependent protease